MAETEKYRRNWHRSFRVRIRLIIALIIIALMSFSIVHNGWAVVVMMSSSNAEIIPLILFTLGVCVIAYCIITAFTAHSYFDTAISITAIIIALVIFTAQNTIEQQRLIRTEEQARQGTIKSLIAITDFNCKIATSTIDTFSNQPNLYAQFASFDFVPQPYVDQLSFLSAQLAGKYDGHIGQSIADMVKANNLMAMIRNLEVQGPNSNFSAELAQAISLDNGELIKTTQNLQENLCSGLEAVLQNNP